MAKPATIIFTDVSTIAGIEYDSISSRKRSRDIENITEGLSKTLSRYLERDPLSPKIAQNIQDLAYETYLSALFKSYVRQSAWEIWRSQIIHIFKSYETLRRELNFKREKAAFMALPDDAKNQYAGKFVAIHGGKIVDSDYEESKLIERFYKNFGKATVYIDKIEEAKPIIHIPTPLEIL